MTAEIDYLWVVRGLFWAITIIIGYIATQALKRLSALETKTSNMATTEDIRKGCDSGAEKMSRINDKIEKVRSDLYRHQEEKTEKIRTDLNKLGDSLRTEMSNNTAETTKLLMQIIQNGARNA